MFEVGDVVFIEARDITGFVHGVTGNGMVTIEDYEGFQWNCPPQYITLVYRPLTSDTGNAEYEEIMSYPEIEG